MDRVEEISKILEQLIGWLLRRDLNALVATTGYQHSVVQPGADFAEAGSRAPAWESGWFVLV